MMDEFPGQPQNIDFYQKGPLQDIVINVGDTSVPMYQDGVITLQAANRRDDTDEDNYQDESRRNLPRETEDMAERD